MFMKKICCMMLAAACCMAQAQTLTQSYYLDFGANAETSVRGTPTTNPDANGLYWNNITNTGTTNYCDAGTEFSLVGADNATSTMVLAVNHRFTINKDGGLTDPTAENLGNLAVATATSDYFFPEKDENDRCMTFYGLDTSKAYKFYIFGSRDTEEKRKGEFVLSGLNTFSGTMQVAGANLGGEGVNHNVKDVLTSSYVFPDKDGRITLAVVNEDATYVAMNVMKIEEYADVANPVADGTVAQMLYLDFGAHSGGRGTPTTNPDANGLYWNNIVSNNGNYCDAASEFALVNSANTALLAKLTINHRFTVNSAGALSSPDAAELGELAVANATGDYFFTETGEDNRTMTFSGLDPGKGYRFSIFASRSADGYRAGVFRFEGLNSFLGVLQAAGKGLGWSVNQNTRNLLVTDVIFPDASGSIILTVNNGAKTYVPINVMKIEEVSGVERPEVLSYVSATIAGDALEEESIPMHMVSPSGKYTNVYEVYTSLSEGGFSVSAVTDADVAVDGLCATANTVTGPARIVVDLNENTVTILPITDIAMTGSVTPNGWTADKGISLSYQGKGVWNYTGAVDGKDTTSDPGRFNFVMNKSWNYSMKRITGTVDEVALSSDGYTVGDIPLNPGVYSVTLDLRQMKLAVENGAEELDQERITVMGSSVANGQGATSNEGYAFMYGEQLAERFAAGDSDSEFYISNISINGNNTLNLLGRYDDLEREFGRYVVFGVSLGNEGINGATDQDAIYNQFKTNMLLLVSMAREDGKYPVVMNNYTRTDFTAADYGYVKSMNIEIHKWDLPSVNLLGAIDNLSGNWADGYQVEGDKYHPTTEGHREFMYAMVPSLFDAIASGKELTMSRTTGTSMTLKDKSVIEFVPEGTVHPFALAITFRGTEAGTLATIDGVGSLSVDAAGAVTFSPAAEVAAVSIAEGALDGEWHTVTLSHYYAQGVTRLYGAADVAAAQIEGTRFVPAMVTVGDGESAVARDYGELMFWRSALNDAEHGEILNGALLKSSLELYAALDGGAESQPNLAMSLNALKMDKVSGVAPVKVAADTIIEGVEGAIRVVSADSTDVKVYTPAGVLVAERTVEGTATIAGLLPGVYIANSQKVMVK